MKPLPYNTKIVEEQHTFIYTFQNFVLLVFPRNKELRKKELVVAQNMLRVLKEINVSMFRKELSEQMESKVDVRTNGT